MRLFDVVDIKKNSPIVLGHWTIEREAIMLFRHVANRIL